MNPRYRTPLKNVRGLGAAKTGTEHFVHQRLTATALVGPVSYTHLDVYKRQERDNSDKIDLIFSSIISLFIYISH